MLSQFVRIPDDKELMERTKQNIQKILEKAGERELNLIYAFSRSLVRGD